MTDFPEPPSPSPERRQARREYERTPDKAGPALTAIGGGIVLLGSFMPWATVASGFATASISGTEGDGKITMVLGLALVILGVIELTRATSLRVLILIAATLAAGIGVVDLVSARERVAGVASALVQASVGVGLYAVVGGGISCHRWRAIQSLSGTRTFSALLNTGTFPIDLDETRRRGRSSSGCSRRWIGSSCCRWAHRKPAPRGEPFV